MSRRYRYSRSAGVDYDQQGYVFFTSKRYRYLPEGQRRMIRELCKKAGGENWRALLEYVSTSADMAVVCKKYFIGSETTLAGLVREYIRIFPQSLDEGK